jgi:MoaA/NifB/PqqE/SkfB family radical SAM enzyme
MKLFRQPYLFSIDLLGACNLRCPSCPTGRRENGIAKSMMAPRTLDAILHKAKSECIIHSAGLINWTEPTLHPQLAEMVRVAKKYCKNVSLSSNLNYDADFKSILEAEPSSLRVSVSGFSQEVYQKGQRGGNIDTVKANLLKLRRYNVSTDVALYWHNYNDNAHEKEAVRNLAQSLGFSFHETDAILMPVEEVMRLWAADRDSSPSEDIQFILSRVQEEILHAKAQCLKMKCIHCSLQTRQLAIDSEGNVSVCCASYNNKVNLVGNFLNTPLREIERLKQAHSLCKGCMSMGAHVYVLYLRNWKYRLRARLAHLYCGIRRHSV